MTASTMQRTSILLSSTWMENPYLITSTNLTVSVSDKKYSIFEVSLKLWPTYTRNQSPTETSRPKIYCDIGKRSGQTLRLRMLHFDSNIQKDLLRAAPLDLLRHLWLRPPKILKEKLRHFCQCLMYRHSHLPAADRKSSFLRELLQCCDGKKY